MSMSPHVFGHDGATANGLSWYHNRYKLAIGTG